MINNDNSIYVYIAGIASFLITILLNIHKHIRDTLDEIEQEIAINRPNIFLFILFILVDSLISSAFGMTIFSILIYIKPEIDYAIYYGITAFISQNAINYIGVMNRAGEKKVEEKIDEL